MTALEVAFVAYLVAAIAAGVFVMASKGKGKQ